ncbi:transporter substrate-binding domain-containing protein [Alteromonas sp. ASW11-19]|uniref:Transporter substrate-binding domain-containing protein n=1 Tax=Alteromonas salexigens TaxID=2982530 RepID=A0ABT2VNE3_9ALTE|nr:transporter substrate-binding domain-containing protein [Alteromonas salexigens]MCU7553484.1 transporter substrate-binding domain-containing protein [Alteromonas salexigens]
MRQILLGLIFALICAPTVGRQIDVVVGWDKPPYVMADTHSGFELELVRQILHEIGHEMYPIYVPFGRTTRLVNARSADIGLTINPRHNVDSKILSDVYVVYQNVAVTLASRELKLHAIDDLEEHTIAAFQTARLVLGEEFNALTAAHRGYLEMPEQQRQVSLLLLGSVDVAVMDRNIFMMLKNQLPAGRQVEVDVHPLFGISPYRAAIADDELRKQFNRTLAQFIDDGRYQALIDEFNLVNLIDNLPTRTLTGSP